jgi:hypothetical protein
VSSFFFTTESDKSKRQDESVSTCELAVARVVWRRAWESLFLGAEDAIQFLHQLEELLSILLHGNARTQLVNVVILCLVHRETGVLRTSTTRVCSMSNNAEGSDAAAFLFSPAVVLETRECSGTASVFL